MDFTTDKLRSMVRKWQTLIEAHVDVKTNDGYTLRMFCLAFTKKRQGQIKRTAYAQSSQVRAVLGGEGRVAGLGSGRCSLVLLHSLWSGVGGRLGGRCSGLGLLPCALLLKAA